MNFEGDIKKIKDIFLTENNLFQLLDFLREQCLQMNITFEFDKSYIEYLSQMMVYILKNTKGLEVYPYLDGVKALNKKVIQECIKEILDISSNQQELKDIKTELEKIEQERNNIEIHQEEITFQNDKPDITFDNSDMSFSQLLNETHEEEQIEPKKQDENKIQEIETLCVHNKLDELNKGEHIKSITFFKPNYYLEGQIKINDTILVSVNYPFFDINEFINEIKSQQNVVSISYLKNKVVFKSKSSTVSQFTKSNFKLEITSELFAKYLGFNNLIYDNNYNYMAEDEICFQEPYYMIDFSSLNVKVPVLNEKDTQTLTCSLNIILNNDTKIKLRDSKNNIIDYKNLYIIKRGYYTEGIKSDDNKASNKIEANTI